VREEAEALGPAVRERQLPLAGVLGDRLRDGLVQAPVESLKLVRRGFTDGRPSRPHVHPWTGAANPAPQSPGRALCAISRS
jgi:hypothetical protein